MLKKLLSVVGVIVALLIWAVSGQIGREVGKAAFEPSPPTEKEIQTTLAQGFEEAARQINAKTPIMIDAETRMDKATVGPGALLTYHYTFPNYTASQLDPNWVQTDLRDGVKAGVCARKEMKSSLEYGGKYKYQYFGKNGKLIGIFVLDRNDCGFAAKIP